MMKFRHVMVKVLGICVLFMALGVFSAMVSLPSAHAASVLVNSHTNTQQVKSVQKATTQKPLIPTGTCGSVTPFAFIVFDTVFVQLTIDEPDSPVSFAFTTGIWSGPTGRGVFSGRGTSFNFQGDVGPETLSGTTSFILADGTKCTSSWTTIAF